MVLSAIEWFRSMPTRKEMYTLSGVEIHNIYYKMLDARGEVLIDDTKISNAGAHRAWHPDVRDHSWYVTWTDKAGQWTIMYTLLDPSLDDQNGDETTDSAITIVNDFEVSSHPRIGTGLPLISTLTMTHT